MSHVIDTTNEHQKRYFMICQLKSALSLEIKGMNRKGQSAYAQAKEVFGLKGSKQKVHEQLEAMRVELLKERPSE